MPHSTPIVVVQVIKTLGRYSCMIIVGRHYVKDTNFEPTKQLI